MDSEKLRKLGLDKAAFFGLLIIGLLIANLIISNRTDYSLSAPIELAGRGVSVSLPVGGGFRQITEEFKYTENEFRIASVLGAGRSINISAHWRYFIVPIEQSFPEKVQSDAVSINGHIENIETARFGSLTFDYAKIVAPESATTVYVGNTILADGQTLSLEVVQKAGNIDLAEELFNSLAESAKFSPENSLSSGAKLLGNLKSHNFVSGGENSSQNYYYVRNYTDTVMGFLTDSFRIDETDSNTIASIYLFFIESGRLSFKQQGFFTASRDMATFKWAANQSDLRINRDQPSSIILDESGTVTVSQRSGERSFKLTDTMIPEAVIDIFISNFVRDAASSVILDIILSDGSIVPALIEQVTPDEDAAAGTAWAARVTFFNDSATFQKTYFDINGRLLLNQIHGKVSYKLVRAESRQILEDFPQWSEKIRQAQGYLADE